MGFARSTHPTKTYFRDSRGRFARGLHLRCPSRNEGAGKTGCTLHPRSRVQLRTENAHTSIQVQRKHSGLPCAMALRLIRALVSAKSARMCERAVLTNRPSLDLSPFVLKGHRACRGAWDRSGVFLNPNSCMGFEPGPSKEGSWMMAQNELVVAGIDVAKDKVDVCIRSLSQRQTFRSTAEGRRELDPLASQTQGRQGGDGGQRRLRARLGQGAARGRHRSSDRRSEAGPQLRPIGRTARQERYRSMRR